MSKLLKARLTVVDTHSDGYSQWWIRRIRSSQTPRARRISSPTSGSFVVTGLTDPGSRTDRLAGAAAHRPPSFVVPESTPRTVLPGNAMWRQSTLP